MFRKPARQRLSLGGLELRNFERTLIQRRLCKFEKSKYFRSFLGLIFNGIIKMKTITLFAGILIMVLFSLNVQAGDNELIDAIQHTQKAVTAKNGDDVIKHAEMAKGHANAAKNDKYINVENKQMDDGIKFLNDAINEGKGGNLEAAREAARDALKHFTQATID